MLTNKNGLFLRIEGELRPDAALLVSFFSGSLDFSNMPLAESEKSDYISKELNNTLPNVRTPLGRKYAYEAVLLCRRMLE